MWNQIISSLSLKPTVMLHIYISNVKFVTVVVVGMNVCFGNKSLGQ